MKNDLKKLARLRELILKENSLKAAASELQIAYYTAHRHSRNLDITEMWVTNEERRQILKNRQ